MGDDAAAGKGHSLLDGGTADRNILYRLAHGFSVCTGSADTQTSPGRLREAGISPRWGGCQWVAFLHLRAYLWRGAPDRGTLLTWRDGRAHRDHGLRTTRVDAGPLPRRSRRQHRR